ncbi:hypothetical protein GIY23_06055 [Allosaccharopolyspora coralli]|uniref:Uncharacterized protein n=1 Tax=Allosaccharopolyspora coralli TaxID=2665642 RepID=A0A5Q3Q3H6_9PSEU|nr:hypothetical protein [Allosaccharopolyspora coralli]QGK69158.1 hypothetical protein GIY23_06055 [Allosaccharopolyspora coralli]
MQPLLHITFTGKGFAVFLAVILAVIAAIGIVYLVFGPTPAILLGIALALLIQGIKALVRFD